ncbi:MAG TPA: amidase [Opitutaceae bacterium]
MNRTSKTSRLKNLSVSSLCLATLLGVNVIGPFSPSALAATSASDSSFNVQEATIADIQKAILEKRVTCTQLVKLYLARVKAFNGPGVEEPEGILGPIKMVPHAKGVNALITLNLRPATRKAMGFDDRKARSMTDAIDNDPNMPDALEVAAKLDAEFAKTGKLTGPLHGVVIAIKDQYDTFDMRTTSGADAFYANDRPPADATFAKRLRAAGAIILGKANMGEYAAGYRSSFGGTEVNPYNTERVPGGSSGGSGMSVATNMVTVAIAEETGPSVRAPAQYNNDVGIAPTQELVSRHGMMNTGINTRVGPIARTVEDAARVLSVIAGYDPKDEMTAFNVGKLPTSSYESFTHAKSLKGMRIGVIREYMDKSVYGKESYQNIDLVNQAIEDLKKLGATIVEPGPEGMFTEYIRKYNPMLSNAYWTKGFPEMFPVGADGKPSSDHVQTLVDLAFHPDKVPGKVTMRDFTGAGAVGESKYGYDVYLMERGDQNIKTLGDLAEKANFFNSPNFPTKKRGLESTNKALELDTAVRLQRRYAIQQIILACMADKQLDALVAPTGLLPARKLLAPNEPTANGIGNYGMLTFIGQQGFPVITVPAGFTTEVYDQIPDPNPTPEAIKAAKGSGGGGEAEGGIARVPMIWTGPTPAKLPVGIDFIGRPFSEPTLLTAAAAYEHATHHRMSPPDFRDIPPSP